MAATADAKVRLGVDDQTKKGLESARRNINRVSKSVTSLGGIANVALGQIAAQAVGRLTSAIKSLATQAVETADRIGKLSTSTKLSTEFLSALRHAANLGDSSLEKLADGFAKLQRRAADAAINGTASYSRALRQMGIDAEKFMSLTADEQAIQFIDQLSRMENRAEAAKAAFDLFGRASQDLFRVFPEGKESLRQFAEEAANAGTLLSTQGARGMENFSDSIARLKERWLGLAYAVTDEMVPALQSLVEWITRVFGTAQEREFKREMDIWREERGRSRREGGRAGRANTGDANLMLDLVQSEYKWRRLAGSSGASTVERLMSGRAGLESGGAAGEISTAAKIAKGGSFESRFGGRSANAVIADWLNPDGVGEVNKTVEAQTRGMERMRSGIEQLQRPVEDLKDRFDDLKWAIEGWGRSFADRLMEGELSFKSFTDAMLREIVRMQVAEQSSKLFGLIGDFIGTAVSGWMAGRGAGTGGVGITASASRTAASAQTGGARQFFQSGPGYNLGPKSSGTHYVPHDGWAYLHKGESVKQAGGKPGGGKQTVNIYNQSGARIDAQTQFSEDGEEVVNVMVRNSFGDSLAQGSLDGALAGSFGLTRGGTQVG